jgi:hypothetical protein
VSQSGLALNQKKSLLLSPAPGMPLKRMNYSHVCECTRSLSECQDSNNSEYELMADISIFKQLRYLRKAAYNRMDRRNEFMTTHRPALPFQHSNYGTPSLRQGLVFLSQQCQWLARHGRFFLVFALLLVMATGCGGGGGDSRGATEGVLSLSLVPVKIRHESGSDRDAIFAAARGAGVTGGYLENSQGQRLVSSDLKYQAATNYYEAVLENTTGAFTGGEYLLKYFVGGETREYKSRSLEWVTIPLFSSSPRITWDELSRMITVSASPLAGDAKYVLELYDANTGSLRRITSEFISPTSIVERVSDYGILRVALVANFYESGVLRFKSVYFFKDSI